MISNFIHWQATHLLEIKKSIVVVLVKSLSRAT